MISPLDALPDDPATLKAIILAQRAEAERMAASVRAYEALIQALKIRIAKLKRQKFGPSSEKIEREIDQLQLALEDLEVAMATAEARPEPTEAAATTEAPAERAAPRRRGKPRIAETTPRERVVLDPGECCPDCGGPLRLVDEDVAEILELVAAQLKVIETARLKKSCRQCERIVQPPAPTRPIPRGMAGPGLLAHILVAKYDDHLPLYRVIFPRKSGHTGLCGLKLGLLGGAVAECGVEPLTVVVGFDVGEQVAARLVASGIAGVVDEFGLQGVEPGLHRRIVPAIALPAHRRHDAARFQHRAVVAGGILTAAVGVVDQSATRQLPLDRHGQRGDRQLLAQVIAHRPSHHLAGEQVEDDGEVQPAFVGRDIADVGQPDFIRPGGEKGLIEEIVGDGQAVVAVGGDHANRRCVAARMPWRRISRSMRPRLTGRPSACKTAWTRGAP